MRRDFLVVFLFVVSLSLIFQSQETQAQEASAILEPLQEGEAPPQGLKWRDAKDITIKPRFRGQKFRVYALIKGWYTRKDWSLTVKKKKIRVSDKSGRFIVAVPVMSPETRVQFVAVGPRGEIERYAVKVVFKDFAQYRKDLIQSLKFKKHSFTAGMNLSYIIYKDSRISDLTETALTVKGGYAYRFNPRWDLGLSFYLTALPLTASGGVPTGSSTASKARFLGINVRAGYKLNKDPSPWSWYLLAGYYYTSMFVDNNAYGFRNMQGPQLFPVVRKQNSNGSAISAYFKFSPVSEKFSLRTLSDNEMALGFAYSLPPKNNKSIAFTLDAAKLKLSIVANSTTTTIDTTSVSLGAAYNF